jgi:hypothetical protein
MITTTVDPEKILERATELAKSCHDLDMFDKVTILRGYLGLRALQPSNVSLENKLDDVLSSLLRKAPEVDASNHELATHAVAP